MDFEAQLNRLPTDELTPGAKLLQALELYEEGVAMQRLNFQRRYPTASAVELDRLLDAWLARETPHETR